MSSTHVVMFGIKMKSIMDRPSEVSDSKVSFAKWRN